MQTVEWNFFTGYKPCTDSADARAAAAALPEGAFPHYTCVGEGHCAFYAMCDFSHKNPWQAPTAPQSVIMGPAPESRLMQYDEYTRLRKRPQEKADLRIVPKPEAA